MSDEPRKWEYRTVQYYYVMHMEADLPRQAAQGWELVSAFSHDDKIACVYRKLV